MAWLGETDTSGRATTDLIEEALYRHRQELFGILSVAFFDTTSLFFDPSLTVLSGKNNPINEL